MPFYLLTWRYHLAETLVHEFGHALHNAAYGECYDEVRQAPNSIPEAGFEICSQLFGGILGIAPDLYGAFVFDDLDFPYEGYMPRRIGPFGILRDWPSTQTTEMYSADGFRTKPLLFKPDLDVIHRIPFSYFEDLFSVTFWDRVRREGAQALKPPKAGTWCFDWQQSPVARYYCCPGEHNANRLARKKTDAASELNSMSSTVVQHILSTGNDCSKKLESECQCQGKRKRPLSSSGNFEGNNGVPYTINGVVVLQ